MEKFPQKPEINHNDGFLLVEEEQKMIENRRRSSSILPSILIEQDTERAAHHNKIPPDGGIQVVEFITSLMKNKKMISKITINPGKYFYILRLNKTIFRHGLSWSAAFCAMV